MPIRHSPFLSRALRYWGTHLSLVAFCANAASPDLFAYDQLILRARAGDSAPVLEFLRRQSMDDAGAGTRRLVEDWIGVAGWAGRDSEVADVYAHWSKRLALSAASSAGAGRALRNLRQWDASISAYQSAIDLDPANTGYRIALVHVLADAGDDNQALLRARALLNEAPLDPKRRLALAYVHTAARRFYAALAEITRARSLAPHDTEVTAAYVDALQSAGLPVQALALNNNYLGLIQPAQVRRLRADVAAELVRLAYAPSTTEAERFRAADAALALYEVLLREWRGSADPAVHRDIARARIDRIGALTARSEMQEAVAEFESLRSEQVQVPGYARRWVAGAYLYLQKPELARSLYADLLAGDRPAQTEYADDASGLFYSLVEVESMSQALALADKTAASLAPRDPVPGQPGGVPSDAWAAAQVQAAQALSFADDTPAAQLRLEAMLALAPGNSGLRTALAGVYRARSWSRRAETELKVAEASAPRSLDVEVQQGFTALDLQEWEQARLLSSDVIDRFPENLQARRLQRLVDVQQKAELRVSGYRGVSSNSPVTGNGDSGIDTVLYSTPIRQNYRIFAGGGYGQGDFPEGRGRHRLLRGGLEWRARDNTVEAEASTHSFGFGHHTGLRLQATHDLNDQWQINAVLERLSRDTPLRALASNVTANSATVAARWRASDRSEWSFAIEPMRYSDGNSRLAGTLLGRERIYTAPRLVADLALEAAASRGVRQDVPYYNPAADFTLVPRIDLSHVMFRHYQTEWRQQLQLGGGVYSERGFSSGSVAFVGYSQRLRLDDVFEAALGISVTRRPYDGIQERIVRGTFDISMRF